MKKKFSKNRGYTLVETLVAVSIFSVSILGLLVTLSQGIANTGYAKKKAAAAYLAEEGVEYMRNMRDTFVLYAADPADGWSDFQAHVAACTGQNGCYLNPDALDFGDSDQPMTALSVTACSGACPTLLYNASTGRYGYTGINAGFVRKIAITQVNADEIKVTSTVSWTQGSGTYSASFSDNLLQWME